MPFTIIIERDRDGCRTFLLIDGVVFVPAIFHTLLPQDLTLAPVISG